MKENCENGEKYTAHRLADIDGRMVGEEYDDNKTGN